ncbi:MAG: hypothetical protein U0232_00095 [Thermomicrobiales bacterium]
MSGDVDRAGDEEARSKQIRTADLLGAIGDQGSLRTQKHSNFAGISNYLAAECNRGYAPIYADLTPILAPAAKVAGRGPMVREPCGYLSFCRQGATAASWSSCVGEN